MDFQKPKNNSEPWERFQTWGFSLQICYFPKHSYMMMKNFAAYLVRVLKRDVMIVIMFSINLKRRLGRGHGGIYETKLIWKDNHPPLKNNKPNSLGRLSSLVWNLTHRNQLQRYDNFTQDQIKEGIVEKVDKFVNKRYHRERSVWFTTHTCY